MRRIALLATLALAACADRSAPWSADLQQSHPQLLGGWTGFAYPDGSPSRVSLLVAIRANANDPATFVWDLTTANGSPLFASASGTLRASRSNVEGSSVTGLVFGCAVNGDEMRGTYRVVIDGRTLETGRLELQKTQPLPAMFVQTIDVYRLPDLDLVVHKRIER